MAEGAGTKKIGSAYFQITPKMSLTGLTKKVRVFASSGAKQISSRIGGAIASITKTAIAAGAAATAVIGGYVAKNALDAYGDYEQLVGGVETLYKDASDQVVKYASTAYKRMGMSANDYMESATSYAAVLRQNLGGDVVAAAQESDKALQQMADNANKMGTDIYYITRAYQGFAKQNYTMLDNLKLGYGGTKTEMERLLADAEKLSGQNYTIGNFADMIDAIQVIQDELGITGTTAKEAATTIQGSIAAAKAAWTNWLTGLADPSQNIGDLTRQLVEQISVALSNIAPRLGDIAVSFGKALPQLLAQVLPLIPEIVGPIFDGIIIGLNNLFAENPPETIAASIASWLESAMPAITTLASMLASTLSSVIQAVEPYLPQILGALVNSVISVLGAIIATAPWETLAAAATAALLNPAIMGALTSLTGGWGILVVAIIAVVGALGSFISGNKQAQAVVVNFGNVVISELSVVLAVVTDVVNYIISVPLTIYNALNMIVEAIVSFIVAVYKIVDGFVSTVLNAIVSLWIELDRVVTSALGDLINWLLMSVPEGLKSLWTWLQNTAASLVSFFSTAGVAILNALGSGLQNAWGAVSSFIQAIPQTIVNFFSSLPQRLFDIGKAALDALTSAFTGSNTYKAIENTAGAVDDLAGSMSSLFSVPSLSINTKSIGAFKTAKLKKITYSSTSSIAKAASSASSASSAAKSITNTASSAAQAASKAISSATAGAYAKGIARAAKKASKALKKSAVKSLGAVRKTVLKVGTDGYSEAAESAVAAYTKKLTKAAKKAKKKVSTALKGIVGKASDYKSITETFGSALDTLTDKLSSKVETKLTKIAEKYQETADEIESSVDTLASALMDAAQIYSSDEDTNLVSVYDLGPSIKMMKTYKNLAKKLSGSISSDLMSYIGQMDTEDAIGYMRALLSLSSEELAKYDKQYTALQNQSQKTANAFYKSQLKTLKSNYADKVASVFTKLKKTLKNTGVQAIKGFVSGLKSQMSSLGESAKKVAKKLVKTLRSYLGISSPSKLMAQAVGVPVAQGISAGILSGKTDVQSAIDSLTSPQAIATSKVDVGGALSTDGLTAAMAKSMNNLGLYVDGKKLANVTAGHRDFADGWRQTLANRGLAV